MLKTAQELKEQAQKIGLRFWLINICSMCGYRCGYVIDGDNVGYDSGCDCGFGHEPLQLRSWEELAEQYNRNQPENNPKISKEYLDKTEAVWKFNTKETMSLEEHITRHKELHQKLDELIADYVTCTGKSLSDSSIMDLLIWSYKQIDNPTEK